MQNKTFDWSIKSIDDAGAFVLYAAVFGNEDRQRDVIEPGAFKNLDEFVKDGFGAVNHQSMALPVAWIERASQDERGLRVEGKFHSTGAAVDCRTVVKERMAAGKSVKCSIGYLVKDASVVMRDGRPVRLLQALDVYEFSFVNVPANPEAGVVSAKAAADGRAAELNPRGLKNARSLIGAGSVADGKWSFTAADGDALLGKDGDDWAAYGRCHLAIDPQAAPKTRGRYKYPFAKRSGRGVKVYAEALRAAASRAAQEDARDVSAAASSLLKEAEEADAHDNEHDRGKSMTPPEDDARGIVMSLKRLLGLDTKSKSELKRSDQLKLKSFAEAMREHGQASKDHAKMMRDHAEKACALAREMKSFLRSGDDDDEEADGHEDESRDDEAANGGRADYGRDAEGDEETVRPRKMDDDDDDDEQPRRKGKGRKTERPEDTDDASPPKSDLSIYRDQLRFRSTAGRRNNARP